MASRREKSLRTVLGTQIRRFREDQGLTQSELAERCDLSLDMIGRVERGKIAPSLETLTKLAEVLAVPVPVLFGGQHTDLPKSPRERSLHQIFKLLGEVDTRDLPWIETVLRAVIKRQ